FNFSPSTQWAAYAFSSYRNGMEAAAELRESRLEMESNDTSLELRVSLELDRLANLPSDALWQLGLSAVIEEADGNKSYWALADLSLAAAFGPQHGLRGDKQDNMIETPDFNDPVHGIPVFSLYGPVRRPTDAMMGAFDTVLIDLQDVGCRIYTFVTTLRYML